MTSEEEENPTEFYAERDVLGQPKQESEANSVVPSQYTRTSKMEPALVMNRFLAGMIDVFIVGLLIHFIVFVWLFPNMVTVNRIEVDFITFLIGCLYHGFFDSSAWQATPGKKWLGIKIANSAGGRISFFNAIGRYLASLLISITIIFFGYINVFINNEHRGWHDILAGTYVIRDKAVDDTKYAKKRKNGYIIAIVLFLVLSMIYLNQYTLQKDAILQKAEMEQEKLDNENRSKSVNDFTKTAILAKEDFILKDSVNGFSILVKKGYSYSISMPNSCYTAIPSDTNDSAGLMWTITKNNISNGLAYGTFLKSSAKLNPGFRTFNIKLLSYEGGYGVEQADIWEMKNNGDSIFSITRAYIKGNTAYCIWATECAFNKPLLENKTVQQIFDSFKPIE